MAYGKIKADAFIYDDGGDQEITVATIASNSSKADTASPTFTGTVTLPATTALAGQASDVTIIDNNAAALEIKEGTNAYMTFDTSDTSEKVTVHKAFDCDSTLNVDGVSTLNDHLNLTAQKELRLQDSSGGQYVAIKAPETVSTCTLTLPANDGDANQYLQTDGDGVLTWADVAGGFTWTSKTSYSSGMIFTGIPSTTTEMVLLVNELTNSSDRIRIQLGTSSAFTNSGYATHNGYLGSGSHSVSRYTDGIRLYAAGHEHSGAIHFWRSGTSGDCWHYVSQNTMSDGSNHYFDYGAGRVETGSSYSLNRMILENMNGAGDGGHVTLGYKD